MKPHRVFWSIAILVFCQSLAKEDSIVETVQAGLNAVNEATNPTVNAIENLKIISKESAEFFKLIGPIGAFISVAAKTYFQSKSPELKALNLLHDQTKKHFEILSTDISSLRKNIKFDTIWLQWGMNVADSIKYLNGVLERLISQSKPEQREIDEFIAVCMNPLKGPAHVLNFIHGRTVTDCEEICNELPEIWGQIEQLFAEIINKIDPQARWDKSLFEETKFELQLKFSALSCSSETIDLIKQMRNELNWFASFSNVEDAVKAIKCSTPSLLANPEIRSSCILRSAIISSNYKTEFMQTFIDIVRSAVEQSAFYCSNLAYNDKQEEIDLYRASIQKKALKIFSYSYNYTTRNLRAYWPTVAVKIAEMHILSHQGDHNKFPVHLPFKIKSELDDLGYDRDAHQVLLSRSYDSPARFYIAKCDALYCNSSIYKFHGYNVVITRVERIQLRLRSIDSKNWCQKSCADVYNVIKSVVKLNEYFNFLVTTMTRTI